MLSFVGRKTLLWCASIAWVAGSGCTQSSLEGAAPPAKPAAETAAAAGDSASSTTAAPAAEEVPQPTIAKPALIQPTAPAAQEQPAITLDIGDVAPPLAIGSWVTGEPLAGLVQGQVHVVEFWATWCGPCLASMPHISQLQQEYGDKVHFVGVTQENTEIVEKFLEKEQSEGKTWREVISYRLALDDDNSATNKTYMRAAGERGIPCAFVVGRDGKIEWIGHPMAIDAPLAKIVEGNWDRTAAVAERKLKQKVQEVSLKLSTLVREEKWDEALALVDSLDEIAGPSTNVMNMRVLVLDRSGRVPEANEVRKAMMDMAWDNPGVLYNVAVGISSSKSEARDLTIALKAAERAVELTESKNAAFLQILARVHSQQGDLAKAVELQKKVVELVPQQPIFARMLKQYEEELAKSSAEPESAPANTPAEPAQP